jgi:hypothetical protein
MPPWRSPGGGRRAAKLSGVITRQRAAVLMMTLLTGPLVMSGCADKTVGETASSTTTRQSASAAPRTPADELTAEDGSENATPFPADAEPDVEAASADASVTVHAIRVGRHAGFDRVVFELGGAGTPGWDVRYVDAASSQGSGEPIDVAGDAVLQVTLTGAGYPYDTGVEEYSGGHVSASGTRAVTEVAFDGTFEGTSVGYVGTAGRAPFRVFLLDSPTRVVVDVSDLG